MTLIAGGEVKGHAGDSRGTRGTTIPTTAVSKVTRFEKCWERPKVERMSLESFSVVIEASRCDEGSATRVEAQKVEVKGSRDGKGKEVSICCKLREKAYARSLKTRDCWSKGRLVVVDVLS
jgi:hypothetical protein